LTAGLEKIVREVEVETLGCAVVWGLLAAYPFGGMTWQVIHYLVGLRRLGFDVWYVEDSDRYLISASTFERTHAYASNVKFLSKFMKRLGMEDRWVFRPPCRDECIGARDAAGLLQLYREAAAVFNLCGAQELLPTHEEISCRVYVETDPIENQVRVAEGDPDVIETLDAHDILFTYGENLGTASCPVPLSGYEWHPTRPPVCVDLWETSATPRNNAPFTTIAKWKHEGKDTTWKDEVWRWSKDVEFRKFIDVATDSPFPLEIAVSSISEGDVEDLRRSGWGVVPSASVKDPDVYREYIQSSGGEFSVAKQQYVKPRSGWFSDRTVSYLAAGRPAVLQDTGFPEHIPTGEGVFAFSTKEEALEGLDAIASDYRRHSRAARQIAREEFGADRVLRDMMVTIGLL
jgi:hypothetical protein